MKVKSVKTLEESMIEHGHTNLTLAASIGLTEPAIRYQKKKNAIVVDGEIYFPSGHKITKNPFPKAKKNVNK